MDATLSVIAWIGGIALLIGIFGGGLKAKEVEIPLIPGFVRIVSSITGIALLGIVIWLSMRATAPLPAPQNSTATPKMPTEVSVSATKGWQNTQVSVQQGTELTMEVISGQWTCLKGTNPYSTGGGYGYTCGPDEASAKGCVEPLPSYPTCALIGKVGDHVFGVGVGTTISVEENGVLYLRMNDPDKDLYDNDGALTVRIGVSR